MSSENPTIEEKFDAFCQWVQDSTGRPVIKARKRMNVQLSCPYCVVDLLAAPEVPKDLYWHFDPSPDTVDKPLKERIRGLVQATFQITAIGGDDAMQAIHRLSASFKRDSWLVFAKKYSFGISETEGMENMATQILSAAYENRAQMKCSFYIPIPVDFDEDYFTWGTITTIVPEKNEVVSIDTYGKRYD